MKFDRQLRPATKISWVVSYGVKQFQDGGRPPFWKSIYRHNIISAKNCPIFMKFCTQQQILNWMNVTWSKMKKLHWTDSELNRTYFLFFLHSLLYPLVSDPGLLALDVVAVLWHSLMGHMASKTVSETTRNVARRGGVGLWMCACQCGNSWIMWDIIISDGRSSSIKIPLCECDTDEKVHGTVFVMLGLYRLSTRTSETHATVHQNAAIFKTVRAFHHKNFRDRSSVWV